MVDAPPPAEPTSGFGYSSRAVAGLDRAGASDALRSGPSRQREQPRAIATRTGRHCDAVRIHAQAGALDRGDARPGAARARPSGSTTCWLFDSHVLWRDPYPLLTLIAEHTSKLRLGTCVTNPGTREPSVTASSLATLDELSGGRMDLGIGRGDSARRVLGKPPITMANTEEAINVIRDLVEGRAVTYEGTELQLPVDRAAGTCRSGSRATARWPSR